MYLYIYINNIGRCRTRRTLRRMRSSLKFGNVDEGIPGVCDERIGYLEGGRVSCFVGEKNMRFRGNSFILHARTHTYTHKTRTNAYKTRTHARRWNVYDWYTRYKHGRPAVVTCPAALCGAIVITPARSETLWGRGVGEGEGSTPH